MKFILVVLVAFIAGCASAPKVGQKSDASYPIVVGEKSSKALRDLQSVGVVGVRDLTPAESGKYEADREKFGVLAGARGGINAGVYSATTSAAAVAGGMALSSVTGVGLLSAILSDERPDNYSFALDFGDKHIIGSASGLNMEVIDFAMKSSFEETLDQFVDAHNLNGKTTRSEVDRDYAADWIDSNHKFSTVGLALRAPCESGMSQCKFTIWSQIRKMGARSPIESSLLISFMSKLPESYFLYIPPNRSIYQLPAVIYGGGRVEYLVEVE